MSSNIRIVLIKTWHAGNIGATARAMKNMGLSELYLVDPVDFPSEEATSRAGQATDILQSAVVVPTLGAAIKDCALVIGTSARDRSIALPALTAEQCAEKAVLEQSKTPVALVFGRERMGLHNDEIQQCHFQVNIDANKEYPVLNLGQAVQILCYEIFKASQSQNTPKSIEEPYPLHEDLVRFQEHLEQTAYDIEFINRKHPGQTLDHLQALFRRARPTRKELSILRGFLNAAQKNHGKSD
ncbi:RNA methyltransferase [Reinekea sp. G2M2-21]|uniref:RNA methyltransferase n=1 Tax=Reinekea sp. G2M2-21 TaxID=2788942 RepID=UPI0018AA0E00|nr:RNA methyltransferase [Reinekea sp. G2M2-21]